MSARRRGRGFTLIELIVFIVVISVGVVGLLSVLGVFVRQSADPLARKQALAIAEAVLEEIAQSGFGYCVATDPNYLSATGTADCTTVDAVGPEAGEVRPYDHVNDYVTAFGTATAFPVSGFPGAAIPGPAGYAASVTMTQTPLNGTLAADSILVSVTVAGGGETVVLDSWRLRHSPNVLP
ncbi:type IV pilus modification PilV family protein [Azospira restricta]|uniref:Prepilin-type N-terminal cleavage/methylation domain-containing protein n=1 Tax=Azospira restricta TaxID=404405 RepID=A0A974Y562_9RHOO|nr:prepilin-type N-terminal cleavage/methylation domain-containing protein [Azospira restricta]QRJ65089.1 prepilin-type N-terminal cleavage/methylation domain-containing protein [Azospira restricta]